MRAALMPVPGLRRRQGAVHVLQEQGKRVPDDVAVVGFDDSSAATAARRQPELVVRESA